MPKTTSRPRRKRFRIIALSKALTEQSASLDRARGTGGLPPLPAPPPDSCHGETLVPTLGSDQEVRRSDGRPAGSRLRPTTPCGREVGPVAGFALDWAFTDQSD
jgi:hypothetical protein